MRTCLKSFVVFCITSLAVLTSTVRAQTPDQTPTPAGEPEVVVPVPEKAQQILDAYAKLDHYKVHKTITITQTTGAVDQHDKVTLDLAVDRSGKQIAISADQIRVVGKDNILRTTLIPSTGSHVHMDNVNPLDPTVIQKNWPMYPLLLWVPDLSLYMGTEVQLFLKKGQFTELPREENMPENQAKFQTQLGNIQLLLTTDTTTNLIRYATMTTVGKTPQGQEVTTTMQFDMDYTLPEKWGEKVFAFDTANSVPVASLAKLINDAQSPAGLEGKAAPPLVLPDLDGNIVDVSKIKTRVVVLDFWATWCGPCKVAMPHMIEMKKWIAENKLDVTVLTVNEQEEKDHVKQFITDQGWDIPVLLDTEGVATNNYRAYSIPQTVFIVDGKIQRIFQGFAPRVADSWREEITKALGVTIKP